MTSDRAPPARQGTLTGPEAPGLEKESFRQELDGGIVGDKVVQADEGRLIPNNHRATWRPGRALWPGLLAHELQHPGHRRRRLWRSGSRLRRGRCVRYKQFMLHQRAAQKRMHRPALGPRGGRDESQITTSLRPGRHIKRCSTLEQRGPNDVVLVDPERDADGADLVVHLKPVGLDREARVDDGQAQVCQPVADAVFNQSSAGDDNALRPDKSTGLP